MALRTIRIQGDPVLEKKCREITEMTPKLQTLIEDMLDTMYDAMGVGLAAPQVGILKRVVVIDVGEGPIVMINPEIIETSGEQTGDEGCLSLPGKAGCVTRPNYVKARFLGEDMQEYEIEGEELLARAICHELDHLDGGNAADLVLLGELGPGVAVGILVAQGDLALLAVKVDDVNVDLVANGDDLRGLMDAAPAQLGHMNHAVDAADVHKCAVAGQGLDHAVVALADLDLVPDGLGALAALGLGNAADGANNALAGLVDLGDLQADGLLEELAQLSVSGQVGLGGGNEHAHALHIDHDAALVLLGDNTFENGAVVNGFLDLGPHLGSIQTLLGQHSSALNVVDTHNDSLDLVANLHSVLDLDAVIGELGSGDEAGVLCAQVNTDLSAGDCNNSTGYLVSII